MSRRVKKTEQPQANLQDRVIVAMVDDMEQAREHEALLKSNDIPSVIKRQDDEATNKTCFAIMVPEEFLDEAHVVIESQDAYDDFYDFAMDDDSDFESDFIDDEF
jgi:hypothetical protein